MGRSTHNRRTASPSALPQNAAPLPPSNVVVDERADESAMTAVLSAGAESDVVVISPEDAIHAGGTPVVVDPDRLVWLFTGPMGYVPRGSLIIVCRAPGFRRAGIEHPPVAVYPFDHFTGEQIRSMEEEPMLQLIGVGF